MSGSITTHRVYPRWKRTETDCCQTTPIVSCCSHKQAIVPNDSPNLNTPKANAQRRQSQRFKAINSIYMMADTMSSGLQQTSPENSPCSSTETHVENINALDDPSISETLKDLRERCKANKRKAVESFATSNDNLNHKFLKLKEEEPDLDEPLICLKLKKSIKSSMGRKQRKCSHFRESSLDEDISASLPTESDKSLIIKEMASADESNSTTESVNENVEVAPLTNFLHAGIPKLTYAAKCEIVETCNAVSSSVTMIDDSNTLGGSLPRLSQKVCKGDLANSESYSCTGKFLHPCFTVHNSPPPVSQMEASPVLDDTQSVNKVKSDVIDIDSLESKITYDVSSSSCVEFVANFSCCESNERIDEGGSKNEDVTAFTNEALGCSGDDIAVEFMETDNCTNLPESCQEHFGEEISTDSSESSCNKLSPWHSESKTPTHCVVNSQPVLETTNLISDVYSRARKFDIANEEVICNGIRNHLHNLVSMQGCTSIDNNEEPRMSQELDSLGDDVPVPMLSACSHESNAIAEYSLHRRGFQDLCHASSFSEEVGSLDSLVHKALCGDKWRNSNSDYTKFHIEKYSSVGTYDFCSFQHSNAISNSSCSFQDSTEISPENENLHCSSVDQVLNDNIEKSVDSAEIDQTGLVNSPIENSCLEGTHDLCIQNAEKRLYTTGHLPTCPSSNISNLVERQESDMENEIKSSQGAEHPPIKLLSNRKDLSPMSQEKLCQALNGSELNDTIKTANDEAEVKLSPEGTRKNPNSSRSFLQRVSKGVLKSHDTSDRNCSCTKSSLINSQAQKAVTFSQRQMQDIETIATKLLKGLTSMKSIVMESVDLESCRSTSSIFTHEEVNIAVENASNLEATTKKWLSMMAKDCNRFCRIMKPAENKEATPVSVRRQPKKITFADEAGGLLCHVKVLEQLPETRMVPKNDG